MDRGISRPEYVWVLLERSHLRDLERLASGKNTEVAGGVRKRLTSWSREKPTRADSRLLRSGRYVAVPADPLVLQALLIGEPKQRQKDAAGVAKAMAELLRRASSGSEEIMPAANIPVRGFKSGRIRSVVSGGIPDSSRRRH